jgi:hypothetical protein
LNGTIGLIRVRPTTRHPCASIARSTAANRFRRAIIRATRARKAARRQERQRGPRRRGDDGEGKSGSPEQQTGEHRKGRRRHHGRRPDHVNHEEQNETGRTGPREKFAQRSEPVRQRQRQHATDHDGGENDDDSASRQPLPRETGHEIARRNEKCLCNR